MVAAVAACPLGVFIRIIGMKLLLRRIKDGHRLAVLQAGILLQTRGKLLLAVYYGVAVCCGVVAALSYWVLGSGVWTMVLDLLLLKLVLHFYRMLV